MKYSNLLVPLLLVCAAASQFAQGAPGQDAPLNERAARPTTEAVERGVVYQINLRAFTPEGTLNAAQEKLASLAELGATIVYLCPIALSDDDMRQEFWSPRQKRSGMNNPRNPYRTKDYYAVDPEYGTDADLQAFVDAAHALEMKVLLDMVYLHCGPGAVFIEKRPHFVKRGASGEIVNEAWSFPGLNFESGELREYLWTNMAYWVCRFGVDGYRLDVGDGIPLDFWVEARRRLDAIRPGIVLLSEGVRAEDQLDAMDLDFGFPFYGAFRSVLTDKKPASEFAKTCQAVAAARPQGARFVRYSDNHDIANDDYETRREIVWGDAANRAVFVANFTLDGTPMLYNGQEIADASRHSIFGNLPIDWSRAESDAARERFAFLQNLIALRRAQPALTAGPASWLEPTAPEKTIAYLRGGADETIYCVVNLSAEPTEERYALPEEYCAAEVLLTEGLVDVDAESIRAELPPFGYAVVKLIK